MKKNKIDFMIEARGLSKYYGQFAAVSDLDFHIAQGEIVCFLGPNGAGKSTTMKLLTGYLTPTAGTARIAGFDMGADRLEGAKHLGYLPENGPLYPDMTPMALLKFFSGLRGFDSQKTKVAIDRVISICDLTTVIYKPIGRLSRGFRQRVGMAQALLHEPDVLILDEPTAGLDPNQIHHVRETIRRIGKTKTILLSTHILQEVGAMASRVLFVNAGRTVFDGTVEQFGSTPEECDKKFRKLTQPKNH